jgi:N-acetylglucosamine-6-sulfatase
MRALVIVPALLAVVVLATVSPSAGQTAARPNVVVVMSDDQTVESLRVMTNVRTLLQAQGTTFSTNFASYPLCCPSRSTFLTGQYAHNHGVLSNMAPTGGFTKLDHTNTLPVWLRRGGYHTVHIGKYLNGYRQGVSPDVPPGWSEWYGSYDPSTYRFYGYTLNENGKLVKYGNDPASYQTDVYADKAVGIVRRRAAAKRPFFLWLSFLAPHVGGPPTPGRPALTTLPARRHLGRFATSPLPTPPSFNEADVSDKPGSIRTRPPLTRKQVAAITERYHLRLESLLAVDEAVGRLVAELKRTHQLSRTLIVFTSDNGFLQGEHRIPIGKERPYEPSTRVPLVMRGPGIPAGLRLRQPVANIDLAPTIVAAARAHAGLPMDGRSLWPLFADPGVFWGRDLLLEGPLTDEGETKFRAVRTPRWLYVRYLTGGEELYDLLVDPDQLTNLRSDPAAAGVRADLRARLDGFETCVGADCRLGPELSVAVEVAGECPAATAKIGLAGAGTASVAHARLLLPGEIVELAAAPWEVVRPLASEAGAVRAHVVFTDGREMTRDAMLPACPPS